MRSSLRLRSDRLSPGIMACTDRQFSEKYEMGKVLSIKAFTV